jgi:myo-inositol-1(or 4)-monophosphatase
VGRDLFSYEDVKGYLSEADLRAHDVIRSAIESEYPGDELLSEEDVSTDVLDRMAVGEQPASHGRAAGCTWVADPICGTTNYVCGIPLFVHALSAMGQDGVEVAGIYHPSQDELFLADESGTTLNGKPVKVSATASLAAAMVSVNGNQSSRKTEGRLGMVGRFEPPVTRRVRVLECANLEMAWVACGRLDAYVNPDDKIWDIAAGSLLVSSAGGAVKPIRGSLSDLLGCQGVIASNGLLQETLEHHMS